MTFLGLDIIAGALVAFAAVPKIFVRLQSQRDKGPRPLDDGDLQRDMLIVAGNMIWVAFGLENQVLGLVVFGAANAILTSLLIAQSIAGHFARPV